MKEFIPENAGHRENSRSDFRWSWLLLGSVLVLLVAIFMPRPKNDKAADLSSSTNVSSSPGSFLSQTSGKRARTPRSLHWEVAPGLTAEEIVTNKLAQFTRSRRETVRAFAERLKVKMPAEVERLFDTIEGGKWEEMKAAFDSLKKQRTNPSEEDKSQGTAEALSKLWPSIMETFGVAEQAHLWPAQQLLDYGNAILGSLRPGTIYVGGTDPGRFIPTLLNETSDGERHIVLTQNAFADGSYLQYAEFLYGDKIAALTPDDSQRGFQQYIADAQKRFAHDEQFPNEPKQIPPGEDIRIADGRTQVSGQVAVMAVNERLLQTLMEKNPDAIFAIEQSFPLKSTYADARPLGPIMELRVKDEQNALTADRAVQSVDYWRDTAQQLLADSEAVNSRDTLKAYSKMAAEQASLLLDRNFPEQAEQTFRLAVEIYPSMPDAVFRYAGLLMNQNRAAEAIPLVENAMKGAPDNKQFGGLLEQLKKTKTN